MKRLKVKFEMNIRDVGQWMRIIRERLCRMSGYNWQKFWMGASCCENKARKTNEKWFSGLDLLFYN